MRGGKAAFGGNGRPRCNSSAVAASLTGEFFDLRPENFNLLLERDYPPQIRCRIVGKRFHLAEDACKFR